MPTRSAEAVWTGPLKTGNGKIAFPGILLKIDYSFQSRFQEGNGTNPEELLGAAHAGCFSMALADILEQAGFVPERITTRANVTIKQVDGDYRITDIQLDCWAKVPGIDQAQFKVHAEAAKIGCPVSRLLSAVVITLIATLE